MDNYQLLDKRNQNKSYYNILNVKNDATTEEIRKAYKAQAKLYHTDVSNETTDDMMKDLNKIREILCQSETRNEYDLYAKKNRLYNDVPNSREEEVARFRDAFNQLIKKKLAEEEAKRNRASREEPIMRFSKEEEEFVLERIKERDPYFDDERISVMGQALRDEVFDTKFPFHEAPCDTFLKTLDPSLSKQEQLEKYRQEFCRRFTNKDFNSNLARQKYNSSNITFDSSYQTAFDSLGNFIVTIYLPEYMIVEGCTLSNYVVTYNKPTMRDGKPVLVPSSLTVNLTLPPDPSIYIHITAFNWRGRHTKPYDRTYITDQKVCDGQYRLLINIKGQQELLYTEQKRRVSYTY